MKSRQFKKIAARFKRQGKHELAEKALQVVELALREENDKRNER